MSEFKFELIKEICVLSESPNDDGWDKVVTLVSWNDNAPKLDIRPWTKDRKHMGKGISLNKNELNKLIDALNEEDIDL